MTISELIDEAEHVETKHGINQKMIFTLTSENYDKEVDLDLEFRGFEFHDEKIIMNLRIK